VVRWQLQISLNDTADEHILEVAWTCGVQRAELLCDLKAMSFQARRLACSLERYCGVIHSTWCVSQNSLMSQPQLPAG